MPKQDLHGLEKYLTALREGDRVTISHLYYLSDLTPNELDTFRRYWADFEPERKRIIIRHLADISEENFQIDFTDVFAHCLSDESVEVRKASLDGLWDTERLSLIEPIINMMQEDKDVGVRALAAQTLGHFVLLAEWHQIPAERSEPIVTALLNELDDQHTPLDIRRAALESISVSPHHRVPLHIREAYNSDQRALRISAVFAMGRSADSRWLPEILSEMTSSHIDMRIEAAGAAGGIGHQDAVQSLAELLVDDEMEVRLAAISSLGKIGGSRAEELLETLADDPEFGELQEAAWEALDELSWLGDFDLNFIDWDNSGDAEPFLSA